MVDVKTTIPKGREQPGANPSVNKRARRLGILKAAHAGHGSVRVVPANEKYRAVLKHPNGMRLRAEGSTEWPNDRFTQRRLRDGSVKIEEKKPEKSEKPQAPKERPSL
jgi:hypothetical protein